MEQGSTDGEVERFLETELTGLGSTDPGCISSVKYFIVLKASRIAGFSFPRLFMRLFHAFTCFFMFSVWKKRI